MADTQPPVEGLAFTITGRDIWNKLSEISDAVAGMPAKVADHEVRIRAIEKKVWIATGLTAILASGGSAWITVLLHG